MKRHRANAIYFKEGAHVGTSIPGIMSCTASCDRMGRIAERITTFKPDDIKDMTSCNDMTFSHYEYPREYYTVIPHVDSLKIYLSVYAFDTLPQGAVIHDNMFAARPVDLAFPESHPQEHYPMLGLLLEKL
jgi:hypothetical protein